MTSSRLPSPKLSQETPLLLSSRRSILPAQLRGPRFLPLRRPLLCIHHSEPSTALTSPSPPPTLAPQPCPVLQEHAKPVSDGHPFLGSSSPGLPHTARSFQGLFSVSGTDGMQSSGVLERTGTVTSPGPSPGMGSSITLTPSSIRNFPEHKEEAHVHPNPFVHSIHQTRDGFSTLGRRSTASMGGKTPATSPNPERFEERCSESSHYAFLPGTAKTCEIILFQAF